MDIDQIHPSIISGHSKHPNLIHNNNKKLITFDTNKIISSPICYAWSNGKDIVKIQSTDSEMKSHLLARTVKKIILVIVCIYMEPQIYFCGQKRNVAQNVPSISKSAS